MPGGRGPETGPEEAGETGECPGAQAARGYYIQVSGLTQTRGRGGATSHRTRFLCPRRSDSSRGLRAWNGCGVWLPPDPEYLAHSTRPFRRRMVAGNCRMNSL